MKGDNIDRSYHFIPSMCLACTRYFIGFCLILLQAYKISNVTVLNEKNEAKRINMWLLICIVRVRAQDWFQNQCAFPRYHPIVKVKYIVLTT